MIIQGFRPTPPRAAVSKPQAESAAAADQATDQVSLGSEGKKKWTVLVYANGKGAGLDRLAPSVIRELEVAGSDDNMNIVAQLGREKRWYDRFTKDWNGTRRYEIERNPEPPSVQEELIRWFVPPYTDGIVSPVKEDLGQVDMGSSASLSEFLSWGIKNYPAEHYAVVIYGQGGGFHGAALDETTGSRLSPKGLEQALREAGKDAGKKIDLVAFDGSLMGQLEMAHQLKDVAGLMVASQGAVNLGSIQMDMVMKDLKFELAEKGTVTPEQLAKWFVFETKAQPKPLAELVNPTLSAYDLTKIDAVKDAYSGLADALSADLAAGGEAREALRGAIGDTQSFAVDQNSSQFYGDYRDLGHFASQVKLDKRFSQATREAAEALVTAAQNSLVDEAHQGDAVANATGMSAYLPLDSGFDAPPTWKQPPIWDGMHGWNDTTLSQHSNMGQVFKSIAEDTPFHNKLRSFGLGSATIHKVDKSLAVAKRAGAFALGLASNIGHWQAYRAARGQAPSSYFGIPPGVGVPMAVAGGAYDAVRGVKQVVTSAGDERLANKKQAIIDGVLDTGTGVAVSTAAVGMLFEGAAGVTRPAGIAAFGLPIVKTGVDMYLTQKGQAAAKEAQLAMTPQERLNAVQSNSNQYYYVSPVVRWLIGASSPGPIDPAKVKA
ncbi:MAG: clostripain-related cysteine peptidase [Vulcanimicrobiota bacterium]